MAMDNPWEFLEETEEAWLRFYEGDSTDRPVRLEAEELNISRDTLSCFRIAVGVLPDWPQSEPPCTWEAIPKMKDNDGRPTQFPDLDRMGPLCSRIKEKRQEIESTLFR